MTICGGSTVAYVGEDFDDDVLERLTDEPDLRGVEVARYSAPGWPWSVGLYVAEHVREEPLESEMRAAVDVALRQVVGVDDVAEEDREVWIVSGSPSPEDLLAAASSVVDQLAERVRSELGW